MFCKDKQGGKSKDCREETLKSGITDPVWREMGGHQPLWNEIKIIDIAFRMERIVI